MKDQKISIRVEQKLWDDLTNEYVDKELYYEMNFSEFIRQKLKKGKEK